MASEQEPNQQDINPSNMAGILIAVGIFLWYLSDGLVKLSQNDNVITVILYAVFFRGLALVLNRHLLLRNQTETPPLLDTLKHSDAKIGILWGIVCPLAIVCILIAQHYLPLMQVLVAVLAFPFMTMLVAPLALKIQFSVRALLAVVLGFVGIMLTMNPHTIGGETIMAFITSSDFQFMGGILSSFHPIYALKAEVTVAYDWAFLAALLITVFLISLYKRKDAHMPVVFYVANITFMITPIVLLIIANVMGYTDSYTLDFANQSWQENTILGVAFLSGFASMTVWQMGFVKGNFTFGGSLTYIGLIWAGIIDYLLFDLHPNITTIVGIIMMTGAGLWGAKCLQEKNKDLLS